MAKELQHEGAYYYDLHPTEEDLMGETQVHRTVVTYLMLVLQWQFREQHCAICGNLNFHATTAYKDYPLAPDIAVIKGVDLQEVLDIPSWRVGTTGPSPQVVFEFASEKTWKNDLKDKPLQYAAMGIKEYYAYDPNARPLKRRSSRRLWGWQLDEESGEMQEMLTGPGGRLWSQHLESFVVPDGRYLRLYDSTWHRRLTQAEAEAERAEMEAEARRAEIMRAEMEAES